MTNVQKSQADEVADRIEDNVSQSRSERRQITVLFCDLVDSTALSCKLDPEDLEIAMQQFRELVFAEVKHQCGLVVRYMGDGALAYFGYPIAQEDAPSAAVRCGLAVLRRTPEVHFADGSTARVRVAAATGISVVGHLIGSQAATEVGVSGMVANLAARILSLCPENSMLIADTTRNLAGGEFEYLNAGRHTLKGIEGLVQVWQPLMERPEHGRYDALLNTTALIGRDEELKTLSGLWRRVLDGEGCVVLIRGEAGIGKTALLRCFEQSLKGQPFVRVLLQCSSQHKNSPLHPLVLHLQRAAGITSQDDSSVRLQKIEALVPVEEAPQSVPLLAELLSIPVGDRYVATTLLPTAKKNATLQLFAHLIRVLAHRTPVLLLVEDAHWIDPTSEELAMVIAAQLAGGRVLVVVAARPQYHPEWEKLSHVSSLALPPLNDSHTRDLVERVAIKVSLHQDMVKQIVGRSGGVPLFAEELTRMMTESPEQHVANFAPTAPIPITLRDSLMARIDRLGEFKHLAQTAAVFGRSFSISMLQAIGTEGNDLSLRVGLNSLLASGLILPVGDAAQMEYVFKHVLVRDCAYDSLLRSRRQQIHGRVAESMERHLAFVVVSEPEVLAYHWTSANQADHALPYWLQSSKRCVGRGANVEAIRHSREGLRLLDQLPSSAKRDEMEFQLNLILGQAAYVVEGPAAPMTTSAYAKAQSLLETVDDPDQRMSVLYGIFSSYHFASRFELAREPANRALEIATRDSNAFFLCQAHRMLGYIAFFTGDCESVHRHFNALSINYDPVRHASLAARYGADCKVGAWGFYPLIKCIQGEIEEALEMSRQNISYAKTLSHAASLGWAYASAGYLHYYLRDRKAAFAVTMEGMDHCVAYNIGSWLAHCKAFHVWADAGLHPGLQHEKNMREAIATASTGNALGLPLLRTALAEVLMLQEKFDVALEVLDAAAVEVRSTSQLVFEPNVCIVLYDCLKRMGRMDLANVTAAHARDAASRMEARYLLHRLT